MTSEDRVPWQPLSRQRAYDCEPASVPAAREFATATLTDWGMADRHDDIRLCVSELATNAVQHGSDGSSGFLVVLSIGGRVMRVEVHDAGTAVPRLRAPDDISDTGRGLFLVAESADAWGVDEAGPSQAVWAEFKTQPAPCIHHLFEMSALASGHCSVPGSGGSSKRRRDPQMIDHVTEEQNTEAPGGYIAPQLIELDVLSKVTLGKYAEDSADKGRYFE